MRSSVSKRIVKRSKTSVLWCLTDNSISHVFLSQINCQIRVWKLKCSKIILTAKNDGSEAVWTSRVVNNGCFAKNSERSKVSLKRCINHISHCCISTSDLKVAVQIAQILRWIPPDHVSNRDPISEFSCYDVWWISSYN